MDLLRSVVALLQAQRPKKTGQQLPETALSLIFEELKGIMLCPADEAAARSAAEGLLSLAAGAQRPRRLAVAALRGVLPALLMAAPASRLQRTSRTVALDFACGLLRERPELLQRQCTEASSSSEASGDEELAPAATKRPSRSKSRRRAPESSPGGKRPHSQSRKRGLECLLDRQKRQQRSRSRKRAAGTTEEPEEPEAWDDPVLGLIQRLCVMTPDRAECRASSAEAALLLLSEASAVENRPSALEGAPSQGSLPLATRFLVFLLRLLRCDRATGRGLAVELLSTVFAAETGDSKGALAVTALAGSSALEAVKQAAASSPALEGSFRNIELLMAQILFALAERCADAVPTVRGRALAGLGATLRCLASRDPKLVAALLGAGEASAKAALGAPDLFRAGALDEKSNVRRAALAFFDSVVPFLRSPLGFTAEEAFRFLDTELLGRLAADDSLAVRRATISSLAIVLRSCPVRQACELWGQHVLPLVLDNEGPVAERAFEEVELAVLQPLHRAAACPPAEVASQLPAVIDALDSESTTCLKHGVLGYVARQNQGRIPASLTSALATVAAGCVLECAASEWPLPVWLMLEEAATLDPSSVPFKLPLDAWHALGGASAACSSKDRNITLLGAAVLKVLKYSAGQAHLSGREILSQELLQALSQLSVPTEQVPAMLQVLHRTQAGDGRLAWKADLLRSAVQALEHVEAFGTGGSRTSPPKLSAALFLIGELALLDEAVVPEAVTSLLQAAALDALEREGQRLQLPPAVRGHAFVALGKLCLRREALAKRLIELFMLHLDERQPYVVRNNVLLVFGDLCAQYTSLAERFLPQATDLLRDPNELLRKQAVMLLASLISEDFVKLRGDVLYRFVYVLSDPAERVRLAMESVFLRVLLLRQPQLFQQHFVDIIYALNGWETAPGQQGLAGNQAFSLVSAPGRRAAVYSFMLSYMSSEQKLAACSQIVISLLGAFVAPEGQSISLPLGEAAMQSSAGQAISDGLRLLCCKEMRSCLAPRPAGQVQDETGEAWATGEDPALRLQAGSSLQAREKLLRSMSEEICPVLIQLKNLMEEKRSPLLGLLRATLLEMLRDWRSEGEEHLCQILAGDLQLAREIAFDLQEGAKSSSEGTWVRRPALSQLLAQDGPAALPSRRKAGAVEAELQRSKPRELATPKPREEEASKSTVATVATPPLAPVQEEEPPAKAAKRRRRIASPQCSRPSASPLTVGIGLMEAALMMSPRTT
eukprot:TRINITY_DN11559_c0_g1_i1.p1 TRINITY_DN11559_c0_g1~~TRINITY_DN11559_c0_g1_i1.p1  ORF type:complete len:1432 (+),score=347.14 TRINITY_DN11559_c0_g1_i1:592-4296(+)